MLVSPVRQTQRRQTHTHMLYLFLSLPIGIISFVIVILTIVMCVVTPIVIVLAPLTLLLFMCAWKLATLERLLARAWLQADVPPMSVPAQPDRKWWQRIQDHLSNPVTWKSLLYLFLHFPFSIFAFNLVISLTAVMFAFSLVSLILSCLAAPFFYLASTLSGQSNRKGTMKRFLLRAITGYGIITTPFYIFNGVAWSWGQFARAMLGMSDKDVRLLEARAIAQQERARAEQADQKRRELIINVSHDLRTPVASIRGHIESLQAACSAANSTGPSPATLQKYLAIVHRESVRLGTLVEDLLSLARTEASELPVNMAVVEVGEVVEEVYQTLMPLARRERQITLVRDIAPHLPYAQADRQRLIQVLLNLVRNAITYTPDGGIVSLRLHQVDASHLALTVSDTGIGIAEEDQERIFERFYRTDASRTRSSGGFGLGLAIVRDFVLAMGGSISVESKVGEGSSFRVLLLAASQQAPVQSANIPGSSLRHIIK